ncbi:MAG: toll/interleukin-1 receptor domain-containing protein [Defluviitaleaceae bacterium]|nr:toll/interleukin-1 receptor domain-containing protein [Defluviitaleaceae bacterium]
MRHDVFISHSSKNKTLADAICHILEKNGVKCWIAPRDVAPGAEYAEELMRGIENSKIFLLIFSKDSNVSGPVAKEVESAFRYGKTVIPYRIEDVEMRKNFEYYLSNLHWLDAYPDENDFETLVAAVMKNLGRSKPGEAAPAVVQEELHAPLANVAQITTPVAPNVNASPTADTSLPEDQIAASLPDAEGTVGIFGELHAGAQSAETPQTSAQGANDSSSSAASTATSSIANASTTSAPTVNASSGANASPNAAPVTSPANTLSAAPVINTAPQAASAAPQPKTGKSRFWLWGCLPLTIIGVIGLLLFSSFAGCIACIACLAEDDDPYAIVDGPVTDDPDFPMPTPEPTLPPMPHPIPTPEPTLPPMPDSAERDAALFGEWLFLETDNAFYLGIMETGGTIHYNFAPDGTGYWRGFDATSDAFQQFGLDWHTSGGVVTIDYHDVDLLIVYTYTFLPDGRLRLQDIADIHYLSAVLDFEADPLLFGSWVFAETNSDMYRGLMNLGETVRYFFASNGTGFWTHDTGGHHMVWQTENGVVTIVFPGLGHLTLVYEYRVSDGTARFEGGADNADLHYLSAE